jgi:hypothetical protein
VFQTGTRSFSPLDDPERAVRQQFLREAKGVLELRVIDRQRAVIVRIRGRNEQNGLRERRRYERLELSLGFTRRRQKERGSEAHSLRSATDRRWHNETRAPHIQH